MRKPIGSMPGHAQLSIDEIVKECAEAHSLGIGGVILFGIPATKDEQATGAYADDGIVQQALRAIKREVPKLLLVTDVCNCEYTSHGHCGLVVDGEVQNDPTLEWLAKSAVSHARAGADIVAPSDMMDGRVAAIRTALDAIRLSQHAHFGLRRQVRLGLLWTLSRSRRIHAAVRRPTQLPDGSRQRARSHARNRTGSGGGCRHDHGEARHAVS